METAKLELAKSLQVKQEEHESLTQELATLKEEIKNKQQQLTGRLHCAEL